MYAVKKKKTVVRHCCSRPILSVQLLQHLAPTWYVITLQSTLPSVLHMLHVLSLCFNLQPDHIVAILIVMTIASDTSERSLACVLSMNLQRFVKL